MESGRLIAELKESIQELKEIDISEIYETVKVSLVTYEDLQKST